MYKPLTFHQMYGLAVLLISSNKEQVYDLKKPHYGLDELDFNNLRDDILSKVRLYTTSNETDSVQHYKYSSSKGGNHSYISPFITRSVKDINGKNVIETDFNKLIKVFIDNKNIKTGLSNGQFQFYNGKVGGENTSVYDNNLIFDLITSTTDYKFFYTDYVNDTYSSHAIIPEFTDLYTKSDIDTQTLIINKYITYIELVNRSYSNMKSNINLLDTSGHNQANNESRFRQPSLFKGNFIGANNLSSPINAIASVSDILKYIEDSNKLKYTDIYNDLYNCRIYDISTNRIEFFFLDRKFDILCKNHNIENIFNCVNKSHINTKTADNRDLIDKQKILQKHFFRKLLTYFNQNSFDDFMSIPALYEQKFSDFLTYFFNNLTFNNNSTMNEKLIHLLSEFGNYVNRSAYYSIKNKQLEDGKIKDAKMKFITRIKIECSSATTVDNLFYKVVGLCSPYSDFDGKKLEEIQIECKKNNITTKQVRDVLVAYSLCEWYSSKTAPASDSVIDDKLENNLY